MLKDDGSDLWRKTAESKRWLDKLTMLNDRIPDVAIEENIIV